MNLLDKLEKKFGRYAIHNLMYYIIILYAIGYVILTFVPEFYYSYLSLNPLAIMRGQIWRLITFIIYPPSSGLLFFLISMYLYYSLGKALEANWGAFRFNLYYLTGILLHIIAAFVCQLVFGESYGQYFGTYYLNNSLFFAFAAIYPNLQFLLFGIIPIRAKVLAGIYGVYFGLTILSGFLATILSDAMVIALLSIGIVPIPAYSLTALLSLGNFLLFFFGMRGTRRYHPKEIYLRRTYAKNVKQGHKSAFTHRCAICGRTEKDGDDLVFRFCSKCGGNYEYCQEHLFTHEHVKKQGE